MERRKTDEDEKENLVTAHYFVPIGDICDKFGLRRREPFGFLPNRHGHDGRLYGKSAEVSGLRRRVDNPGSGKKRSRRAGILLRHLLQGCGKDRKGQQRRSG